MSLFKELKRRNVVRVAIAYAIAAWLLIEITATTFPILKLPDWSVTLVTVLVLIGFPLALIFAWAFELTPEGLKKEKDVDRSESITHFTGRKLDFIIIAIMAMAIIVLVSDRLDWLTDSPDRDDRLSVIRKSVAVLPFVNRSADASDAYFVDGIHDDLLTQLSKIRALKVISRTSVEQFRDSIQSMREIGASLGAASIIEGAVQRSGDRVRITVQLIDTESDEHLWAKSFDREISTVNIFAIQREIATTIARQLRATLTLEEQEQLSVLPTQNFAAYDLYLRGVEALRRPGQESLDKAADIFRQALDLDSEYARAYAGLCDVHLRNYRRSNNTALVPRAESYCQKALELDQSLIEVRLSLGDLHITTGQYDLAERQFNLAKDLDPESDAAYRGLGRLFSNRSQLLEAEEAFRHAIKLAPDNWEAHDGLAAFFYAHGRIPESIEAYKEAANLVPERPGVYNNLGVAYLLNSDYANAEGALRKSLSLDSDQPVVLSNLGTIYFFEKRFAEAAAMFAKASVLSPEDYMFWAHQGDAARFIDGKEAESNAAYDTAIRLAELQHEVNSSDIEIAGALARIYATRNHTEKAERFIKLALEIGQEDMYVWYDVSLAYLALGQNQAAIDAVERLLEMGYPVNVLANDAMFSVYAENARFQKLVSSPDD